MTGSSLKWTTPVAPAKSPVPPVIGWWQRPCCSRERDQVVLGRGLEAEREAAGRLDGAAASVAVRVEAPLELLGPRPGDDSRGREHAEQERRRSPVADQRRTAVAVAVHPVHVVGRVERVTDQDQRLDAVDLRRPGR